MTSLPERPSSTPGNQMPALTGIRFVLALWVVGHHLSGPGRMLDPLTSASAMVSALFEAAYVSLTVFFAISGFVLARRYGDIVWTRLVLIRYAVSRFGRIYPLYFLSLLILGPIIWEALRRGDLGSPIDSAGLLLNYGLLLQGWHKPAVNWNTPAWSLSCEVFFYACAPLLVRAVRVPSWARVLGTTALACAVPIALRLTIEPPIPKALLYFGDFVVGIAAAGVYERLSGTRLSLQRLGPWLYWTALGGGLTLLLWGDGLGSFLVFDAGVRLTSMLLVIGLACGGGWLVRVLSSPVVLAGGTASYAIYILHVPALWWFERSSVRALLPPVAAGVVFVIEILALSLVVSRWYEVPANRVIRLAACGYAAASRRAAPAGSLRSRACLPE
jgi:peptidoglycan/LPS O-acetylase OafA/YrhL